MRVHHDQLNYNLIFRSFLYYLDGKSLLLKPINITIKPLIDHVSVSDARICYFDCRVAGCVCLLTSPQPLLI